MMRARPHWTRAVFISVAAAVAFAGSAATLRRSPQPTARAAQDTPLPAPVSPAFIPGTPRGLGRRHLSYWAPVRRRVAARAAPSRRASSIAVLDATTPEGTDNAVSVLESRRDRAGRTWVRARLPHLPPATAGWIPRTALGGYTAVDSLLDVDLETLTLTLYRAGLRILRAPIGVGMHGWDTPRGTFYIRNKLTRYRSPQYGPVAFGTSARSAHATDWPAGGFVGIHGTDQPDRLPGRVSHGCIRLRNTDVVRLARHMPIGTPVRIR
jgi:lipoprotein-anchoring transpeptidase ErfK/SrfK